MTKAIFPKYHGWADTVPTIYLKEGRKSLEVSIKFTKHCCFYGVLLRGYPYKVFLG